jgi:hypothetical protein
MRYMLLIYQKEPDVPPSLEEGQKAKDAHWAVIDETTKLGIFRGAEPLQPTSTATTIRMQDGKALTCDGPFAETKEQLAGYYILDCKDLDQAIQWASRLPLRCSGGTAAVEIRPIRPIPPRTGQPDNTHYATTING